MTKYDQEITVTLTRAQWNNMRMACNTAAWQWIDKGREFNDKGDVARAQWALRIVEEYRDYFMTITRAMDAQALDFTWPYGDAEADIDARTDDPSAQARAAAYHEAKPL